MTVKKINNRGSDEGADDVGKEVDPVAGAAGDEVFLHQFGDASIGDADDDGKEKGLALIGDSIGDELLAIPPEAKEGEGGIHEQVCHLVEAHDGLDMRKNGTRKSCQNQDDDSTQNSRVAISGQSFQD